MNIHSQTYFNFAFFVIFPLFFLYHVLVAKNIIPPILGGYFSIILLLNFPFLIVSSILQLNRKNNYLTTIEVLFFILLIYFLLISIINFIFNSIPNGTMMLIHSLQGILFIFTCYILGKYVDIHNIIFQKIIIFTLITLSLIIFSNLNEYSMFDLSNATDLSISYQGYARVLTIIGFLSMVMIKNIKYSIAIYILASIALFLNGARTEFAVFMLVGALYYIFLKPKLIIPLIIIITSILLLVIFNETLQEFILHNRFFELLTNPENSTSGNARFDTIVLALQTIKDNPLFGDYGSYIAQGGLGWYAHSIISAWVDLGLLGFMLYMIIFFLMFLYLVLYKNKQNSMEYQLFFLFFLFVFIVMIFSKNYSYMLFGFLVAFYSRTVFVK